MGFFEAMTQKKKMLKFYPNAVHLEIIDWNNKRENIVLKNHAYNGYWARVLCTSNNAKRFNS